MNKFLAIFLAADMFVNSLSCMAFKTQELDPQPKLEVIFDDPKDDVIGKYQ